MEKLTWTEGINSFKEFTLEEFDNYRKFTTTINEHDFEPNRNIHDIFYDHLKLRQSKTVEVLYSGGMDSEFTLLSCIKNKVPAIAMTMRIFVQKVLINVVDIYHAEKFCREHDIPQKFFDLDAEDFFNGDEYITYLEPYKITKPHVATHFWLINKCHSFPIMGGDWPWVQTHKPEYVLSPFRVHYHSYGKYMDDNSIFGIGNMLGHSFESCYYFIKKHTENSDSSYGNAYKITFLKEKMFGLAPRFRSYGWENCPKELFNINKYELELIKRFKISTFEVKWGDAIKSLIGTNRISNNSFA